MNDEPEPSWEDVASWWLGEIAGDPSYEGDVSQLVRRLIEGAAGRLLDVGCGDGRLAGILSQAIGIDIAMSLLRSASDRYPVARVRVPDLGAFRSAAFDGAVICLVLEHIREHGRLLEELARVVRHGGRLVLVANHPIFTAPGSAPIQDRDGELLWRPGEYFGVGHTDEPAGGSTVRFHHRTMGELMTSAARAGWTLDELIESGPLATQLAQHPALEEQRHIPRLMGARWTRR